MTHIWVSKLDNYWLGYWIMAWRRSHYLTQCWLIVNSTPGSISKWNVNQNSNIFIQANAFENVVCQKSGILSRPQYVNTKLSSYLYLYICVVSNNMRYIMICFRASKRFGRILMDSSSWTRDKWLRQTLLFSVRLQYDLLAGLLWQQGPFY